MKFHVRPYLIGHSIWFWFQQCHFIQTLLVKAIDEETEFFCGGFTVHSHPFNRHKELQQCKVLLKHHHGDVSKYSSGGGIHQLLGSGLRGTHCNGKRGCELYKSFALFCMLLIPCSQFHTSLLSLSCNQCILINFNVLINDLWVTWFECVAFCIKVNLW